MKNLVALLGILFFCFQAYTQKDDSVRAHYSYLLSKLNSPDTIYIYEVKSSWGRSVANFISVKNGNITSGYFLHEKFVRNILTPRGLLPGHQTNLNQVIIDTEIMARKVITALENRLFCPLQKDRLNKEYCSEETGYDGDEFLVVKITGKKMLYVERYMIYESFEKCPHLMLYKNMIEIDRLIKHGFKSPNDILKKVIAGFTHAK